MKAIYVRMLNSLCFSIICEAKNVQSMQDLPLENVKKKGGRDRLATDDNIRGRIKKVKAKYI